MRWWKRLFFNSLTKPIFFVLAKKYFLAGENPEDAVRKAKELKEKGVYSLINILGEHNDNPGQFLTNFLEYLAVLKLIVRNGLENWVGISVKPSQFGLGTVPHGESFFKHYLTAILLFAEDFRIRVEIDAEGPDTLGSLEKACLDLAGKGFLNFRVCVQANQARSIEEIKRLNRAGVSVRLCVGAYNGDVPRNEIETRFLQLAALLKLHGTKPAFAGHSLTRINELMTFYRGGLHNLELQFLLGVENKYARNLVGKVGRITFYLACGKNPEPFIARRWDALPGIWWRNFWQRRRGVQIQLLEFEREF